LKSRRRRRRRRRRSRRYKINYQSIIVKVSDAQSGNGEREEQNHKILLTDCNSDKRYGRRKKKLFPNEKPGICQVS